MEGKTGDDDHLEKADTVPEAVPSDNEKARIRLPNHAEPGPTADDQLATRLQVGWLWTISHACSRPRMPRRETERPFREPGRPIPRTT